MILIISENNDLITDQVIEWLYMFNVNNIVRINEDDAVKVKEIDIKANKIIIELNNCVIDLADVDFYWYRRGNLNRIFENNLEIKNSKIKNQVVTFLNYEWLMCKDYILDYLQQKKSLGNFFLSATNKLINLKIAKECGLEIPDTYISESIKSLNEYQEHFAVITKPLSEAMHIYHNDGYFKILTKEVNVVRKVDTFNDIFPTLLQKKIEKHFEIRVLVLCQKLYSMAIFSQNNNSTAIDYRNYDPDKMNRMIPYILPDEIKNKILLFMSKVRLDTGSLDLIKTIDNKYIFLEVNPAGNIEMVNNNCCYNLEKKIAEIIIEK